MLRGTLTACAVLAVSQVAFAQNAAGLFKQGRELAEKGKWAEACPLFAEANRIEPRAVGIKLNMAECYKHIGKTASAWNAYNDAEFLAKKENDADRAKFAHNEAAAIEPKLSKLRVNAKDTPGLQLRRDDAEIAKGLWGTAIPVDPGEHKIEATAPGYSVWTTVIKIGLEGDLQAIEIPTLTKAIEPPQPGTGSGPNPALRPAAFAVGGVGAAGLIVGGIFGGLALSAKSTLTTECPNNVCTSQAGKDARASAGTKALVSSVGLGVGGAALATGVVLFIVSARGGAPKPDDKPSVQPKLSFIPSAGPDGGGLNLVGSF